MDGQLFLDYAEMLLKQERVEMKPAVDADTFISNKQQAFELADIAACEFAKQTMLLRKEGSITTVDGQREYNCPPDLIRIAKKSPRDDRTDIILYTEAGDTEGDLIYRQAHSEFWDYDTSQEEDVPGGFDIIESPLSPDEITGTTTAAGAVDGNGASTLTDGAVLFTTPDADMIYPRYRVRNTTAGKTKQRGIVLSVTDDTNLQTAMFRDAVPYGWGNGETYAIQSASRFKLIFDYACSTSGDTVKLDYYCLPPPVFTPVGMWGFPDPSNVLAVACYVVWLLKVRNVQVQQAGEVNTASLHSDRLFLLFQDFVDKAVSDKRKRMHAPKPSMLMRVM